MRVLFTSVSALGHVHTMVPLAREFQAQGHEVLWATGPDATPRLERAGIAATSVSDPWEDLRAEYHRRYPEATSLPPAKRLDHIFPRLFGEISAVRMFPGVLSIARGWQPHLIVHDAGEFSGPIAAAAVSVPSVTHAFGSLTPASRVAATAQTVVPLWRSVGLEPRPYGGLYDHLYLDIYPASLQSADMTHVGRRHSLRPVAFDDAGDKSFAMPDLVDARPLVYLTFGTIDRDRGPLRTALEAIATLDVHVLVTVGPTADRAVLGPQPANVRVESYVPQTQVLRHCAAVASHAGSGTFLATVARGIPQLCLPQAADQFVNAAACVTAGVGLSLRPEEANGRAIADAIARLLNEDSFSSAAAAVAKEIDAMPSPVDVVPLLARLGATGSSGTGQTLR